MLSPPPSQSYEVSKKSAADYVSQHALNVASVYVRAVATYALTLHNPSTMAVSDLLYSLEGLAHEKGGLQPFKKILLNKD